MKRYLSKNNFQRFISDFEFLFDLIRNSSGEYDLRLRDNYFNIYYRGNSMMKIKFRREGYEITIHKEFICNVFKEDEDRFQEIVKKAKLSKGGYKIYHLNPELLHPFLQSEHLKKIARRVKKVNYGEEIAFEQALITDNLNREDYLIIDRQVTEPGLGHRMDLLGLRRVHNNNYAFEVIEVKLGNNIELKESVARQLSTYLKHIKDNFDEWKESYENTYKQLKQTNIFAKPVYDEINITPELDGRVIVIGYSGIADGYIKQLEQKNPNVNVQQIKYLIK